MSDDDTTPWWRNPNLTVPATVAILAAFIGLVGVLISTGGSDPTPTAPPTTTSPEPPSGQTTPPGAPPPPAPAPNPSSRSELYANERLTLRYSGCGEDHAYVTLDHPPGVSKSSSEHDAFAYYSCAEAEPVIRISSDTEVSPLNEPADQPDACLTALRTDEARDRTPISEVTALCFRTSGGTIAQLVVSKVDRDGTAHVLATGWKDE